MTLIHGQYNFRWHPVRRSDKWVGRTDHRRWTKISWKIKIKYEVKYCIKTEFITTKWKKKFYNKVQNKLLYFITPSVGDGCNSFDIVCLSFCVCVCVCLSVTTLTSERTDIRTWFLVCRSSGRISRSSSKVKVVGQRSRSPGQIMWWRGDEDTRSNLGEASHRRRQWGRWYWAAQWQKSVIQAAGSPPIFTPCIAGCNSFDIIYLTPYMNGRAMTRGVFKAYVFFFSLRFGSISCYPILLFPEWKEVFVKDCPYRLSNFLESGRPLEEVIPSGYTHTFLTRHPYKTIGSFYNALNTFKDNAGINEQHDPDSK